MAERAEKIAKGLTDAKKNKEVLEQTEKMYTDTLARARNEAETIFTNAKREAETKKTEMLEKAKTEVTNMVDAGKRALETEKTAMVSQARGEIITLAMLATEKILGTKVEKVFDEKALKELKDL